MTKKIKSGARVAANKTRSHIKKAKVKVIKAVKSLRKEWEAEKPRRENFKRGIKLAANKMFSDGLKIGKDVAKIIKKDIREINNK